MSFLQQAMAPENADRTGMLLFGLGDILRGGSGANMLSTAMLMDQQKKKEKADALAKQQSTDMITGYLSGAMRGGSPNLGRSSRPGPSITPEQAIGDEAMAALGHTDKMSVGGRLMSDLQRDFGFSKDQAAGIVGNLSHESAGFGTLQEVNPIVPGSRGGFGYAQWTGPRRKQFEQFAEANNLDPTSYEANYGFLKHELTNTPEGRVVASLRNAPSADEAARVFSDQFLRPGIPHMASRVGQAQQFANLSPDRAAQILQSPHVPDAIKKMVLSDFMPQQQEKPTSLIQNAQWLMQQGYSREDAIKMARSGVTVNNNQIPNAPAGYRNVFENGQFVGQEVIPGGPADYKRQQEEAAAAAEAAASQAQAEASEDNAVTQADTVLSTINEIRDIDADKGMFDIPEFGIVGDFMARKGLNQEAVNVRNKIASLESAIAFDRLQRMREASPTGGALGAVSERELALLAADLGSLKQSSDRDQFFKVLDRVEKRYSEIMRKFSAYPDAAQQGATAGGQNDPLGLF